MRIFCKYKGLKGFVKLYNDALRYQYMITKKALRKARVLAFWEKHGLQATAEAFGVKRRTLFLWKRKLKEAEGKFEGLNEKKTTPKIKRKRIWPLEILAEIKRLRWQHPNLGKEKLSPELKEFCDNKGLKCPQPRTIGRLIKDLGGLRIYPQRISHFGRIKPIKRQKILRKPKDFQAEHPGHCVALDTVEKIIGGKRRYIITFQNKLSPIQFMSSLPINKLPEKRKNGWPHTGAGLFSSPCYH